MSGLVGRGGPQDFSSAIMAIPLPFVRRWVFQLPLCLKGPCGPVLPNEVYRKCVTDFCYRKGCFLIRIDVREEDDGTWNMREMAGAVAAMLRQACGHRVNLLKIVEREDGSCGILVASLSTWTSASTSRLLITVKKKKVRPCLFILLSLNISCIINSFESSF